MAVAAGGVLTTLDTVKKVLDGLRNVDRKIAICINNETEQTFTSPERNVYFKSGTSDLPLPERIEGGQTMLWGARKDSGPVATGTTGVFTYSVNDGTYTLAVMWSVPFDFNLYSSWWNVKMYSGRKYANKALYKEMYKSAQHKGDNAWHGPKDIGQGYTVKGSLAKSSVPTLEIHVKKE